MRTILARARAGSRTERLRLAGFASLLLAAISSLGCGHEWWGEPTPYYGPPKCSSNEACVTQHDSNWYCDKDNRLGDNTWPICKSR